MFHGVADGTAYPSERPFLLLLAVMLGMAAWYRSKTMTDSANNEEYFRKLSLDLLKFVDSNVVELMDQPSVTAVQTCILLGSHHVYHGRPNLSFALLGATIKMSQALGMHREPSRGDFENIEERKRVWWTIYTWDRFASITYGRPLGINDKDCNVSIPADVFEIPTFVAFEPGQSNTICYSTYQRELNQLYLIASPALETIFGSRTLRTSKSLIGDAYATLVKQVTQSLKRWRSCLPSQLALDLDQDFHPDGRPSSRAYALQSLSLQLTYDNLLIVLHRPLLARHVDHLSTTKIRSPENAEADSIPHHPSVTSLHYANSTFGASPPEAQTASSELWMDAAVRTSRVTELPALAQLATDSHLVAFLAINLFNAAIVLTVMALSDPLSDTAQMVKRTITRILRLQELLGSRTALSKQSTVILKNVVTMLLRRESEVILAPIAGPYEPTGQNLRQMPTDSAIMSVEDTLRLPLDGVLCFSDPAAGSQLLPDLSRASRLNESLTTVQYVLPAGNHRSHVTPSIGDDHRESAENRAHQPISQPMECDWNELGVSPLGIEDPYLGNGESGMYWLWDRAWNGADV
ncbi:fungal-specific transcription factor domain-containing protein [Penicillium taxi]|uniref:fungal-specific transcription factor domain-containing protein n=1 Tax=Penicillium taxi TaxID=168475 RepID=UPI0025450674|nr:fungal-specific transcription factor domain-containing protein [Penicillium taxi]KAJ5893453.1 fungal-specific transcription factor domain-containing protein [Penicillium taxi]